ncbi:DUF3618 domain-containing protein [Pseudomonas sp. BRM28]|uniref:DUF3618 domain-containing protein n=1 Tax=Pseudomonas sp. BRM28 TaxID=2045201 RepID=UPI000CEE9200|nr:DUF3618 domain-containing protein [Pseudomonas sp. BRM28]PPS62209.1 hypothetical protein CR917_15050 [Pseudomonas sp. BRM28]
MSTSFEAESHKSPETLEQEIDAKRASISHLVDSLEHRLTPGQLIDQGMAYFKGNGGEFFQNLGITLKNNPVPTVLTGVGLAWLALNQNRPFSPGSPTFGGSGLADTLGDAASGIKGAMAQAGEHLHHASDVAHDKARDAGDSLGSSADKVRQAAHHASDRVQAQAAQLKGQFDHLLKDQPLVLAAIGIALGAALGAALPGTRKEDELMGETRDALADKVTRTGKALYADATQAVHNADASAPAAAAQAPREGPADLSDGLGFRP